MDEWKKYKLPRHQNYLMFLLEKSEIFKEKDPCSCHIDEKPDNIKKLKKIKLGKYEMRNKNSLKVNKSTKYSNSQLCS